MEFEMILQKAKEGNQAAMMEIVEMYKPLPIKNAIVKGIFDEDLYQELVKVLLFCIKRYRIIY